MIARNKSNVIIIKERMKVFVVDSPRYFRFVRLSKEDEKDEAD